MITSRALKKILFSLLVAGLIEHGLFAQYFEKGCQNYTRKNYETAREMFLKEIEADGNPDSYYFLGEIEKNDGDLQKAEEYFQTAVTKNITNKYLKLAYWNLIILIEQRGRYDQMVRMCRELWGRLGDGGAQAKVETLINKIMWSDSAEAIGAYTSGLEHKKNKMMNEAQNAFNNAIQYDSKFLAPKFELGLIYFRQDNISSAIYYLNEVVEEIPFYGELHLLLGDMYYRRQSYQYSINHYNQAMDFAFIDKNTEYILRLQRGASLFKTGDYENAAADIKAARKINSSALEPLLILSAANIKTGNYDEALESLKGAERISPNNPEIVYQIGSIYYRNKDPKYASSFERLLDIVTGKKDIIQPKYLRVFVLLLKNSTENGNYQKAAKIIEIIPDRMKDYEITLLSARTYHHINNPGKAIENFEKLSLSGDDRYLLAADYAKSGMDEKSKRILWDLSHTQGYLEKAKSDSSLRRIAVEIEREKSRIEEEKRKVEEERKRLEAERVRQEDERRRDDERKRIEAEKEAARIAEETARKAEEEKKKQLQESPPEQKKDPVDTADHNKPGYSDMPPPADNKNNIPDAVEIIPLPDPGKPGSLQEKNSIYD